MQNNQTSAEGTSAAQQGMTGEELAQFKQFKKNQTFGADARPHL